ncbi:O-succinylbenzoate synthase [Murinocardiopsis flavida]|uniref:O-succinylbenzoate synthase n=1 Tax=Murinocardiopsis flavida TaxID=645275 RepID=A0A2P8DGQ7_9ACTN|nr:enolase C-terminal domain-like protein [Murinocardiopsis flavida]PSK96414.1 O-succinylbenzoate synthase [Murinocardiopsis flavida]
MSRTEPATLRRVATIDAALVRLPLVHPKQRGRSTGTRPRSAEHILVRVADGDGRFGWGEIPAADESMWRALVKEYGPALLGHPWQRPTDAALAWDGATAMPEVRSGLDTACWDLWSRWRESPLSHALGGTRTAIATGVTLGRQPSLQTLVQEVNRQVGSGFRRIRLGIEPGWDLEAVRAVQESFPYLVLQVDGCGRYSEDDPAHLDVLRALDGYGLLAIEQPFPAADLAAHARLRRDLRTPLALAADTLDALDTAVRMEAADALNLRIAPLGGLTNARRAHDRAVDAGWQVWCDPQGASDIGRAAMVALASLPGVTLPSDVPGAGGRFARALTDPPVRTHEGVAPVPLTRSGIGHTVAEDTVRSLAVEAESITDGGRRTL